MPNSERNKKLEVIYLVVVIVIRRHKKILFLQETGEGFADHGSEEEARDDCQEHTEHAETDFLRFGKVSAFGG